MHRVAYTVDEDGDGFVICTRWTFAVWESVLSPLAVGICALVFSRSFHAPALLRYCLAALAMGLQAFRSIGTHETLTTITRLEANISGCFPHSYKPACFVLLASIVYLTYREKQGGGEDQTLPAGLWAALENGSECLVPALTKDEADELALRIENRFRHLLGSGVSPGSSQPSGLITLGLYNRS